MKLQIIIAILIIPFHYIAQDKEPDYTRKAFVTAVDTNQFKNSTQQSEGLVKRYEVIEFDFFDRSDDGKSLMKINQPVLVYSEGYYVGGKKSGLFHFYIIDSATPNKRYKVWELNYFKDKLNGSVKAYTLQGTIAATFEYLNDSIVGKSAVYSANGKFKTEETEYKKGMTDYIKRTYSDTAGYIISEEVYKNSLLNGKVKTYYPKGGIEYEDFYIDGKMTGTARYYYPSGRLNMELEFRNDKPWNIIGSYSPDGTKRNGGDLKNGNGTIIRYDEKGDGYPYLYHKGESVSGY